MDTWGIDHRPDWVSRWLGVMAVTSVLTYLTVALPMGCVVANTPKVEYERGKLTAQSKAHYFIRHRISPEAAGRYYQYLEAVK